MRKLHTLTLLLPVITLLLFARCGQEKEESNDIPITTESEEAREAYLNGLEALDFGRQADARTYFDAAIESDPKLAIADFYRACGCRSPLRSTVSATSNRSGRPSKKHSNSTRPLLPPIACWRTP